MHILFLCRESDAKREVSGFASGMRANGHRLSYMPEHAPPTMSLRALLAAVDGRPDVIFRPETQFCALPRDLLEVGIPTACLNVDMYAYPEARARWSTLFDYAVSCVPGFEPHFRAVGHKRPLTMPYGVERALFEGPELERDIEVGWVGTTQGPLYAGRRRMLAELERVFSMNDWRRRLPLHEAMKVFRRSRIVVNIARDDFPSALNIRAFEVMAAGALLVNPLPDDLTALGFREGQHFIGYRTLEEAVRHVRHFLAHASERETIARAGQELTLSEFTYERRVRTLLDRVAADEGQLFAPARSRTRREVARMFVEFYASHRQLGAVARELRRSGPLVVLGDVRTTRSVARGLTREVASITRR